MEKLIGINELSQLIGARKQTIYRWIHEQFIPHHKVGGLVRFRPSEIDAWLNKRKRQGKKVGL